MQAKAKTLFSEELFRNSLYLMLSTATMALFGFVFWLLVAHLYLPAQLGVAATLIASMNFITHFSLLGLNSTFLRFLPRSKNRNQQIDTGLIVVGIGAMVAAGLFVLFAPHFAPKLGILHRNILFGLGFILLCVGAAVNLITDSIFIAYRSAGYNLVIDGFIGSSIQLLLPIALVGLGAYGIFAAQGSAAFAAMIVSIAVLMRLFHYQPRFKINVSVLHDIKRYSSASYIASLLAVLPTIILPIIILDKLGAAPAGYYYLAFMMANLLFAIAYAVAQSLFTEGSYGERRLRALVKRSAFFLAAIMIPASLLLAALGTFVLNIFGRTYGAHSHQVIMVLAAAGPFVAANALGNVILSIRKQLKALVFVNLIYALIICTFALAYAHKGLAWVAGAWLIGYAVSDVVIFGLVGWQYRRHLLHADMPA